MQYRHTLENLGKQGGMSGTIFRKAQNRNQDPVKLERLIKMIQGQDQVFRCAQGITVFNK